MDLNIKAYKQGQEACVRADQKLNYKFNPYKILTNKWKSWNKGWNSIPYNPTQEYLKRMNNKFNIQLKDK